MEWVGVYQRRPPVLWTPNNTNCPLQARFFGLVFCLLVVVTSPEIREMSPHRKGSMSESSGASHQESLSPGVLMSEPRLQRLSQFLEELMTCRGVPGLTLSVVVGDQVALRQHYGMADIEAKKPVTDDTIFCVASLTKAFTSVLLAKLLEKYRYTWDTKVRDVLGEEFRLYDKYTTDHVTVRDLLLHRTGVQRHDLLWFSGKMNKTELYRHLGCLPPSDGFRSSAIYNNIMYSLAGRVAEVIGGKSWEELITEEILVPFGLNDTTFFHQRSDVQSSKFAKQYAILNGRPIGLDHTKFKHGVEAIAPAIGLCSNSKDMAQWMRFILSSGKNARYNNTFMADMFLPQVVASDFFYSHMQRPRTPVSLSLGSYGLGWLLGHYRGFQLISHYGSFPGFLSMVNLLPIYDIGIFTSINGGNQDLPYTINSIIHTYILDLVLGETPWLDLEHFQDAHSEACYFPMDHYKDYYTVPAFNKTVPLWRARSSYEGKYASPVYADLDVSLGISFSSKYSHPGYDVHAPLRMTYGRLTFSLYPVDKKPGMEVFIAESDDREWMIPPLSVYFHVQTTFQSNQTLDSSNTNDGEIVALELPEFRMEADGNIFIKVQKETWSNKNLCYGVKDEEDIPSKAAFVSNIYTMYFMLLFLLFY